MLQFDHLAIAAESLSDGVASVEDALGVPLAPGGMHPSMGTHNRLLALGPGEYLEVIAIDPEAARPGRPRWFGLDDFRGAPRPCAWVARGDDLASALALSPSGAGVVHPLARGDFRWEMAIPETGLLPFHGLFPALISWKGTAHPADVLPDRGVRLRRLVLSHPDGPALRAAVAPLIDESRLTITLGARPHLAADFDTPHGTRVLA
ncbi:VOC family protein [Pararhodobacter sp. SW119]|uniref:VOC family protein n=1 Tax=Pararhodobacter sp. SW119 TaxID=2780075 RepID=UPI001AE020A0|nr:VOC family protein [Pararhodobacter sp. SW119]